MNLFRSMDISASGLTAERLRLDVIADNIANANTTRTPEGGPYRRKVAVFAPREDGPAPFAFVMVGGARGWDGVGEGVRVVAVRQVSEALAPFRLVYQPGHPDADERGYVRMPNVDVVKEMVDMITATRAYEANVTAMNAAKAMFARALEIGRA